MDLDNGDGKEAVQKLEAEFGKGRARFFPCDVTNSEHFTDNFQAVIDTCGQLDILINNAGIMDDSRWDFMIDLNFKALVRGSLLAMDHMGKHNGGNGGTIVNVSSIVGLTPTPFFSIYSGTKHAVVGFSLGLRGSYEKTGVRVLVMCPGITKTPLITECSDKTLEFVQKEDLINGLEKSILQAPEKVASAMIDLIEMGENGAVWVAECNEPPYAIETPHYSAHRKPI
ncbi:15-hydroxyprostaglandin dehydrogenase [NAD(+)]-like isoform X2 [Belonocnema kinseyi]|nr:15-hydroxyprostaglandin dehydrogenase [NAD(+)]-like isoform X2 [Belonocnema kinseyi]XP_033209969.1 15-hydroxyprostaglandin dehydrogenase [NAD(+)]-like isoform X2 [Belonocnema kinseyi]